MAVAAAVRQTRPMRRHTARSTSFESAVNTGFHGASRPVLHRSVCIKDGSGIDPACGSGGMFVQAARYMHNHNANEAEQMKFRCYGVEKEPDTVKLAKMNLLLNNVRGDITEANSFYSDPYNAFGAFDYVMANPPFNVDEVNYSRVSEDSRFNTYGVPRNKSKSSKKESDKKETVPNANYLWIGYFATALNEVGRAALVMANSASDATGSEYEIRKKMIEDGIVILCLNYDGLYGINNINRLLQENNPNTPYRWGLWTFKVGDPILFNESERFMPVLYNNLKGTIVDIEPDDENDCIWFSIEVDKALTELDVWHQDLELLDPITQGKSVVKFRVTRKKDSDDDNDFADDTDIPFQIAYAVSIHKAQGLEYDSVKVIITKEVDEMITHNIFYTAITRSKQHLKIYWSPESQEKILSSFEVMDAKRDASIFAAQSQMKMRKL